MVSSLVGAGLITDPRLRVQIRDYKDSSFENTLNIDYHFSYLAINIHKCSCGSFISFFGECSFQVNEMNTKINLSIGKKQGNYANETVGGEKI